VIAVNKLTVDQIRLLLKVLCIRGYASATKFKCHQLLGVHVTLRGIHNLETNPNSASVVEKKLNSELRKIQAFFHPKHFEEMMKLNALKGCVDHENHTSEKVVWSTLADMYNSVDPDEGIDQLDFTCRGDKYKHLIGKLEFSRAVLSNFVTTPSGGLELKRYFFGLFKLCRQMKYLISESGTHSDDPLSYINHAKTTTKGAAVHRLALYYFYVKCKENLRVDTKFVTSMPNQFKGSSDEDMEINGKDISPLTKAKTATSTKTKTTAAKKEDMLQSCAVGAFQSITEGLVANAVLAQEANTTNTRLELLKSNVFLPTTSAHIKLALLHAAKMDVPLTPAYVAPSIVCLPAKKRTIAETLVSSNDESDDDGGNEMTIDDLSKNLLESHYSSKNLLESSDIEEGIYS
jgi:hypothetical protein